ncbi:MAG: NAD(P)/FAD-dependent oxidoreductase, partial [Bacilli bacterium]|nr:NAD(P)/FAD-dependent oxidoreductase [Bacilli bacterium]
AIARNLACYSYRILVLEKENDVGDGTSCANSAILHSGYDPEPGTKKAYYNVRGNALYDQLCAELDVQIRRTGSLTLANSDEEILVLKQLKERAKQNNVPVELLGSEQVRQIEPFVADEVKMALFAPTAGIVNPFELVIALMENAMDNGVELHLNEKVTGLKKKDASFLIETTKAKYETKMVINAAGIHCDEIDQLLHQPSFTIRPRRGEYVVLDHLDQPYVSHVLFSVPTKFGKGVLFTPTTHDNYLIGPTSDFIDDKEDVSTDVNVIQMVSQKANRLVTNIPYHKMIRQFAGLRAVSDTDDFIVEETSPGFINVAGIQSPGLVSAPAIALDVVQMVKSRLVTTENPNYQPRRRKVIRFQDVSPAEKRNFIEKDPRFAHIVCRCEQVSEGEVLDGIHRNCGATTIKGVKKRSRPGSGKCQGGFCEPLIINILARELGKQPTEIEYARAGSFILQKRLGDSDENS